MKTFIELFFMLDIEKQTKKAEMFTDHEVKTTFMYDFKDVLQIWYYIVWGEDNITL